MSRNWKLPAKLPSRNCGAPKLVLYDLTSQHMLCTSYTEIFMVQEGVDRTFGSLDPILGESTESV